MSTWFRHRLPVRAAVVAVLAGGAVLALPPVASANSTQRALVQFFVCPDGNCTGIRVSIEQAAKYFTPTGDYSNCTTAETDNVDVPITHNGQIESVSAEFKNGGSCFAERARNTWLVKVWKDKAVLGKGLVAIQEDDPFLANYYATCDPWHSPWSPVWDASKVGCDKQAASIVQVSVPGARPKWPDCPSAEKYCYVNIDMGAGSNPLDGRVACGGWSISSQVCQGASFGTKGWTIPELNTKYGIAAYFSYTTKGSYRHATYESMQSTLTQQSQITGTIPASGDSFAVSEAHARASDAHFKTGDSAPVGAPGGPLYFNYSSSLGSATVVIEGYLLHK